MLIEKHRVARLQLWLNEFDGKISLFCRNYGLPRTRSSYLSQIMSGNRSIGERAARKLEQECGRPQGWLDLETPQLQVLKYDTARVSQLPEPERHLIEGFIEFVLQRSEASAVQNIKRAPLSMTREFTPQPEQVMAITRSAKRPIKTRENEHTHRSKRSAP